MRRRAGESGAARCRSDAPRHPNPHLPTHATVKQVFAGLGKAGLRITANTATLGAEGTDVVTKVYGTYLGWPFEITEYRSEKALSKALAWQTGEAPGTGEPPIAIAGSNILIVWGPRSPGPSRASSAHRRSMVSATRARDRPIAVTPQDPHERARGPRADHGCRPERRTLAEGEVTASRGAIRN